MLEVSRLYSFLDHKNGFNIHFLEGQKFIHDLALIHQVQGSGFAYFRDIILGVMPAIFFLKPGDNLGIYIDSEEPYFRLKIETNYSGHTRTLLLPEEFNQFPMKLTGKARVTKSFANEKSPYTSIIDMNQLETKEVLNQIFTQSYQTDSEIIVANICDQSMMITKLPAMNVNLHNNESISRDAYIKTNQHFFKDVFDSAHTDIEKIVKTFEDHGLAYLGSRQINYFCPCSKERMVRNIIGLYGTDTHAALDGKEFLEVKCDYCHKAYKISEADLKMN
ncbi:MAG: Hsp33 family molecular chaperone HslO [Bacteriovoracaceae bacterium]|jgi:molecular chaperone Hsp33